MTLFNLVRGGIIMNSTSLNRIERIAYQFFTYSKYILVFIWIFKQILIVAPGGDDGGGGI